MDALFATELRVDRFVMLLYYLKHTIAFLCCVIVP